MSSIAVQKRQVQSAFQLLVVACILKLVLESFLQFDIWSNEVVPKEVTIHFTNLVFMGFDLLLLLTAGLLINASADRRSFVLTLLSVVALVASFPNIYIDGAYEITELGIAEIEPVPEEFNFYLVDSVLNLALLTVVVLSLKGGNSRLFGWIFMVPVVVFKVGQFFEPQWLEIQEQSTGFQWFLAGLFLVVNLCFGLNEEQVEAPESLSEDGMQAFESERVAPKTDEYWQQTAGLNVRVVDPCIHPLFDQDAAKACYGQGE